MFEDYPDDDDGCCELWDFDYDEGMCDGTGWDSDLGCYRYDGFPCPEASSLEEAEMVYWNTH